MAPKAKSEVVVEEAEVDKKTDKKNKAKANALEDNKPVMSLEEKKKKMAEKAKKLAESIEVKEEKPAKLTREDLKLEVEDSGNMLVPLEDYVKSGIYLGTKVITTDMRPYVYKRRTDGLAIINTKLIDEKVREAISFISKYEPGKIIAMCKREAGWKALLSFSKATGIRVFTKKYPAGIVTNSILDEFFEPGLVMITDPWLDKNPIADANQINVPLVGVCDTNNLTSSLDIVIPGNNKSNKSIGLIYWLLARGYMQARKMDLSTLPELSEFVGEQTI